MPRNQMQAQFAQTRTLDRVAVEQIVEDPKLAEAIAAQLTALAYPARLRILSLIINAGEEGMIAADLVALGLSQPTISQHLRILREAGFVFLLTKEGTRHWYTVNLGAVESLALILSRLARKRTGKKKPVNAKRTGQR